MYSLTWVLEVSPWLPTIIRQDRVTLFGQGYLFPISTFCWSWSTLVAHISFFSRRNSYSRICKGRNLFPLWTHVVFLPQVFLLIQLTSARGCQQNIEGDFSFIRFIKESFSCGLVLDPPQGGWLLCWLRQSPPTFFTLSFLKEVIYNIPEVLFFFFLERLKDPRK